MLLIPGRAFTEPKGNRLLVCQSRFNVRASDVLPIAIKRESGLITAAASH